MAKVKTITFPKWKGKPGGAQNDKTVKYVVNFEDKGQDFTEWHVNKYGFVVKSSPFQTSVWKGTFCDLQRAGVGVCPPIVTSTGQFLVLKYKITNIEEIKK